MKKHYLLLFVTVFIWSFGYTQKSSPRTLQLQIEALGPGSLFSINLDSRFLKRQNGLGFRVGIGGSPLGLLGKSCNIGTLLTLPAGINYLIGKQTNFLELGAGGVLAIVGSTKRFCVDFKSGFFSDDTTPYTFLSAGYRYQPLDKKKIYRVFISPLFQPGFSTKLWGGISIGHRL